MVMNEGNMLIQYISVFSIICVNIVLSYNNRLFTLISYENISESHCGMITDAKPVQDAVKLKVLKNKGKGGVTISPGGPGFSFVTISTTKAIDPLIGFERIFHEVLYGRGVDIKRPMSTQVNSSDEYLMHWPTGQVLRADTFQDKGSVHLPFLEYMHRGHCRLKITKDFMQTAVDAFAIFVSGDVSDVERLPGSYVLQSARTISMMRIAREKLAATWNVVKGNTLSEDVTYETLEKYRPLFKYVNGREMARLNLMDKRILSFIGTHPDLNRHQVGVVASKYISINPRWTEPKYLNIMNNLLCGVPMIFMRRIPENTYLQLTHQIFYHIRACDPLQRRFYLAMMMRTQALGKSYSWSAREVSRLGLLLADVSAQDLSAIKPEAMSGITAQVMIEMPIHSLKAITEMQIRYLEPKPLNILARKLIAYEMQQLAASNPAARPFISPHILLIYILIIILIVLETV